MGHGLNEGSDLPHVFKAVPMIEDGVEIIWVSLMLFGGEARRELYAYCGELKRQDKQGISEQAGSPRKVKSSVIQDTANTAML